jgi:spermine oxidase
MQILQDLIEANPYVDVELVKSIYQTRLDVQRADTACEDLRILSAVGWNAYKTLEGNQFTRLKPSYSCFVDYIRSQIPNERLWLNRLVERVSWSNTNSFVGLNVLNKLTGESDVIFADFVISTTSLGYLKSFHHSLFEPELPLNKVKAIENLGFGVVNKVFVIFEKPLMRPDLLKGFDLIIFAR